jgi:glucose-6-phosphate isomerase
MPIALAYGMDAFEELLSGARAMDDHFINTPLEQNLPVILALFGIWNRNFLNRGSLAVLPYAENLSLLSNFLQQLDMESNGKHVDREGNFITDYNTGPVIFGQAGTNGQHAFHQWLHQGTDIVPCEFITVKNSPYDAQHHRVLNANATAQARAFAVGAVNKDNPHKDYAGGRPSVTVTISDINPFTIGSIIALYEHKVFCQGVIWNINSFDQFGVELGKQMAMEILNNN